MADSKSQQQLDDEALVRESEKQKALADAQEQAAKNRLDEIEEGGHYIVNGVHVNADGVPLKDANKDKK